MAGGLTVVADDIAIYHTRLDGDGLAPRRTMQHYFSRGGWRGAQGERKPAGPSQPLTDWVLLPKQLAEHTDPELKVYCECCRCRRFAAD